MAQKEDGEIPIVRFDGPDISLFRWGALKSNPEKGERDALKGSANTLSTGNQFTAINEEHRRVVLT